MIIAVKSNQKNLGIKIGTKEEAYWTEIRDSTSKELEQLEKMVKFNKAILLMCEDKIEYEQVRRW